MPMYKKSLCILLFIALVAGGSIFYNYSAEEEIALDEPADTAGTVAEKYEVTVYVSGEVTSPGVVTLDSSCRVKDAISACGDFTPLADKNGVNLAQKLTDGMQINVPAQTAQQNTAQNSRAKCQIRAEFLRQCRNREHQYGNERAARHTAGSRPCHCRQNH